MPESVSDDDPLGLRRGAVSLSPYDHVWARLGDRECAALQTILGHRAVNVQHVGSTAVDGLDAKPILDIAVGLHTAPRPQVGEMVQLMEDGGYVYRGDHGTNRGLLFVRGTDAVRTVHVHMIPFGDTEWTNYIGFRDYLRATPQRRHDYQHLKRDLAARHAHERGAYTDAKAAFILDTLRLAAERAHALNRSQGGTDELVPDKPSLG
jgi:GrpB-like predicted nucleotidyltransferase (UPF0157 family)